MRKHRFAVYAVMTATVLFSAMAGTSLSTLANSAEFKNTTVTGNPATPGNASSDTGNASSDTGTASDTEKETGTENGHSTDQNRHGPAQPKFWLFRLRLCLKQSGDRGWYSTSVG